MNTSQSSQRYELRFRPLFIERWSRPHLDSAQGAARDSSYSWPSQFVSKKEHRR